MHSCINWFKNYSPSNFRANCKAQERLGHVITNPMFGHVIKWPWKYIDPYSPSNLYLNFIKLLKKKWFKVQTLIWLKRLIWAHIVFCFIICLFVCLCGCLFFKNNDPNIFSTKVSIKIFSWGYLLVTKCVRNTELLVAKIYTDMLYLGNYANVVYF